MRIMKSILYYLFNRQKIVIHKEGDWVIMDVYDCFLGVWMKVFEIHEKQKEDYLLQPYIDDFKKRNPKIKIIDKRFEPNTYYQNL